MKWVGVLALSAAAYATTAAAQAHIRCQNTIGGPCGDSSRPREYNCCDYGYCQPWNSGYYQCIDKPAKCPNQETDIDYAGNDIKTVYGLQPDKCCDECAKTADCKAYTFVNQNPDGKTACYLKTSAAGRVEKKGAVSATVIAVTTPPPTTVTPPPPPANCPVQENNVDYYGNDLKTLSGVTQGACCDECEKTDKCVAYTFLAKGWDGKSACYLKSSIAGKVAKDGAVSGQLPITKPPQPPPNCPEQEWNVDYYGNDIKTLNAVTQTTCCDECGKLVGCVAYTFVEKNADGKAACYLKSSTAGKVAKAGAVSGKVKNPATPPPPANCPVQENNVDYYGNDLKTLSGVTQGACCDECQKTDKCVAYTFLAKGWDGKSACYLKSSIAGKVAKDGAVSGQVTITKPPPPPPNCPEQEWNVDYYGNDLKTLNGGTQTECCDACGKTEKCVAYSFVAKGSDGKSACYLKSSTAGKVAKAGVVSGKVKDPLTPPPPPPPANCPVQENDVDYYGNDLKTLNGVTQTECCDTCGKTDKCVGYSFVAKGTDGKSACYLKSSTAGKVAKAGVVSGKIKDPLTPPPPPPNCPVQENNVDYYGSDLKTINGATQTECCDACGKTDKCVAYSFVAKGADGKSACYLKSSTAGRVAKNGVVSGKIKYIPTPGNCPTQELNIDYPGDDIKTVKGVTYGGCCDACGATSGCRAFTYVEQNPDGKSACYLKRAAGKKVTKDGAISGLYECPTAVFGKCGSSATGPLCCPFGSFCQPWDTGFYQCIPAPDAAKCPTVVTGVDFYGGDLEVKYGLLPGTCCEACFNNKDCVVFTFVNENADGRSACYLKSKLVEQRAKAGAVSGYKIKGAA